MSRSLQEILEDYRLLDDLIETDYPGASIVTHEDWFAEGQIEVIPRGAEIPLLGNVLYAFKLLLATKPNQALLLNQVDRAPQLAAIFNRLFMVRKRKIVLYDVFIDTPSKFKQLLVRWQVEGASINVLFSRFQVKAYMRRFNLPFERFAYIPYQASHSKRDPLDETYGDYVFSGGNSARDYRTLCEAARGTAVPFKITSTKKELFEGFEMPEEINLKPVVEPEFTRMMAGSRFVIMALTAGRDRGYGEQTILNSWWHGRAVVVADDVSASDYITDGEDGYVLDPEDVEGLRSRIVELYNDPAKAEAMGRKGREKVRNHYHHTHFLHRMKLITLALAAE